jgi:hypothetical protein
VVASVKRMFRTSKGSWIIEALGLGVVVAILKFRSAPLISQSKIISNNLEAQKALFTILPEAPPNSESWVVGNLGSLSAETPLF